MASALLRLALRTDKKFDEVKEFVTSKQASGFAVVENAGGENEHYHWYLELLGYKNVQTFRVGLTKKIPDLKGNGAYSVKECDDDYERYWQYMAKGDGSGCGARVVWRHGLLFTDEKMEELHQAYWSENREKKRVKVEPVIDVVFAKLKADGTAWRDREAVAHAYIRELYNRNKPINLYSVKSAVNLLQVKLAPVADEAIKSLAESVGY